MRKSILAFCFLVLLACAGIQSTVAPEYAYTDAPKNTLLAAEASGTPALALTSTARVLTQTAYIAAFPTLNQEQGQIIRQTQANFIATESAFASKIPLTSTVRSNIMTANAQSRAEGTNPAILTEQALFPALTANASAFETENYGYSLTATSIIATATAATTISPTPCPSYAWTKTRFNYSEYTGEDWLQNPYIEDSIGIFCMAYPERLFSHEVIIARNQTVLTDEMLYSILEDLISHLPDYPPHQPEISEDIALINIDLGFRYQGIFTYTEALAAYESGLRGADLAEALGVHAP